MDITLRQLQAFIAVSKTGSFSSAAEMLHVTQPALTLMIKKLEHQLGVKLLERSVRGARLTTTGREFFPAVQRLVDELSEVVSNLTNYSMPRDGTVTLASIPSFSGYILPDLLARFSMEQPKIRVILKDAIPETRNIIDMVRTGALDFGIGPFSGGASELQFRKIMEDQLVVVARRDSTLAHQSEVQWVDLTSHPIIGLSYQSNIRMLVDDAFRNAGISKHPVSEVSLITTAIAMVRARMGVTVLPTTAVYNCNLEDLCMLRLIPTVSRPLGLIYRSMTSMTPAAARLFRYIADHLRV